MKRQFYVVYDYGQGGVWAVVAAESADSITQRFPELQVVDNRPAWMTNAFAARLEARVIDIESPTDLLADILRGRLIDGPRPPTEGGIELYEPPRVS